MESVAVHYGWLVSPYSAKTRTYIKHKGLAVQDVQPTASQLMGVIRRSVGRLIMPTVRLADGTWLQDSSVIIDHFESEAPEPLIVPPGVSQCLAASLLEVFADEWLSMASLHYRWTIPENAAFARGEFARCGLPWAPRFLGRRMIASIADKMESYLPVLGIDEVTTPGVEAMVEVVLGALEAHFAAQPYLFGGRPSLGDFSLFGPLWAHLYRDPGSRFLFEDKPNVRRWMDDLLRGAPVRGAFLEGDEVPAALDPLFACALEDQWAWIRTLVGAVDAYCAENPDAARVPRALGEADLAIRGRAGRRKLVTFVQWKAQRARAAYDAAEGQADAWLRRALGLEDGAEVSDVLTPISNPLILRDFKPVLKGRVPS